MNKYELDVIVPVYNVERYLSKCVESILAQTFCDFRLILVDDGSTDRSGELCDQFAELDSRITVIHKENGGLSSARNAGLDISEAPYICLIDSDDYIESVMFDELYRAITDNQADMSICNFRYVYIDCDEPNSSQDIYLPIKNTVLLGGDALKELYTQYGYYYVVAWNKMYSKKLFEEIRYPIGKYHEDEFVIHELFYKCDKIACVQKPMYNYVQRSGSIMAQKNEKQSYDVIEAFHARRIFYHNNHLRKREMEAETLIWVNTLKIVETSDGYQDKKTVARFVRKLWGLIYYLPQNATLNYKEKIALVIRLFRAQLRYIR